MSDMEQFKAEMERRTKEIEQIIEPYLPEETGHQKTVLEAMNYSMKAGGKRLRPMLMQEVCRLFTGDVLDCVIPFMAAVEMIHTSSLVHDDLAVYGRRPSAPWQAQHLGGVRRGHRRADRRRADDVCL